MRYLGGDVTHWFDKRTKEPRKRVNLETGLREYFCNDGPFLHMKAFLPHSVPLYKYFNKPINIEKRPYELTIRTNKTNSLGGKMKS